MQTTKGTQGFLLDAEADDRVKNPISYTHNKFLSAATSEFRYYEFTPAGVAEKIANQFKGEKLPKVAEILEKAADKHEDQKEGAYFLEVAKELRLRYEFY